MASLPNHVRRQTIAHTRSRPRVVVLGAPRAELAMSDLLELAVEVAESVARDEAFEEVRGRYSWCTAGGEEFT